MFNDSNKNIKLNKGKTSNGQNALDVLKITSKSALGSILFNASGTTVDNWIRVLGSENEENRGILSYNKTNENGVANNIDKMLIVADDVVGGTLHLIHWSGNHWRRNTLNLLLGLQWEIQMNFILL